MKDKQVYRELQEITSDAMENLKKNFAWVAEKANVSWAILKMCLKISLVERRGETPVPYLNRINLRRF